MICVVLFEIFFCSRFFWRVCGLLVLFVFGGDVMYDCEVVLVGGVIVEEG